MSITTIATDFIGDVKLSIGKFKTADLQAVTDNTERDFLVSLLGYELYVAFIAGLTADPPAAKWTDLKDGVTGGDIDYTGIKKMLLYFIYNEWITTGNYFNSVAGQQKSEGENSSAPTQTKINELADDAYNKGVALYKKAKDFIDEINSAEDITSVDGLTVYTENTKYLLDGDTVIINGVEYTISGVVANTSFDTNSAVGNATQWQKDFYEDLDHTCLDLSVFGGSL